jgi:hypothetical protein
MLSITDPGFLGGE